MKDLKSKRIVGLVIVSMLCVSCAHQPKIAPAQEDLLRTFQWYSSPNPNGSSSISFSVGGKQIYIDPVILPELFPELPKADLILITHTHLDHYSLQTIRALSDADTKIAGVRDVADDFKDAIPILSGNTVTIEGLEIKTYPAYNLTHPQQSDGLAFTVSDGNHTVFISGDTDMLPEYRSIHHIDVAVFFMFPMYTLSDRDAVKLARSMKPSCIIPVHWIAGMEDSLFKFEKQVSSISQVRILEKRSKPGKSAL